MVRDRIMVDLRCKTCQIFFSKLPVIRAIFAPTYIIEFLKFFVQLTVPLLWNFKYEFWREKISLYK